MAVCGYCDLMDELIPILLLGVEHVVWIHIGEILVKASAKGHIYKLQSPADSKDRHVML